MKALGYVFLAVVIILVVWAAFRAQTVSETEEPATAEGEVERLTELATENPPPEAVPKPGKDVSPVPEPPKLKVHKVTLSASGFSVGQLSIKQGEKVVFTNQSGAEARIPSNPHPIHSDLPALDSGTLKDGQSYSFTFDKAGTFGVHNHFNPSQTMSITVSP